MERMVCARLRYHLDSSRSLSLYQAGFSKGKSTLEPILRLVNSVHKGFLKKQKSGAVLIDLSRAFDKVDHHLLLMEFVRLQIPSVFGRWFHAFLRDRRYTVSYGTAESRPCRFSLGVPQGSGSGPLLFIIFMDNLCVRLYVLAIVLYHLFADDITLWATDRTLAGLARRLQKGINVVLKWSRDTKMPVSIGKNELIVFSMDRNDFKNPLTLRFGDETINAVESVRLLGVWIDRSLSFAVHTDKVVGDCSRRLRQMLAISGTDWGSSSIDLRALYVAYIRSKLLYGSPAFQSLLSNGRKDLLNILERKCLRLITGCARSSPSEDLYFESNLLPLQDQYSLADAIAAEKYRRFPDSDPMSELALAHCDSRSRLKGPRRLAWSQKSDAVLRSFGMTPARKNRNGKISSRHVDFSREPLLFFSAVAPWKTGNVNKVILHSELLHSYPQDAEATLKRARAQETIAELGNFDAQLWTDGTCDPSTRAGLGAWELYGFGSGGRRGVMRGSAAAGLWCSSYRSEGIGLKSGLDAVLQLHMAGTNLREKTILVCTDSQSQVKALETGPLLVGEVLQDNIWKTLVDLVSDSVGLAKIVIQWIPGHCGLARNESVDRYAEQCFNTAAIQAVQQSQPIPLSGVVALLKCKARAAWLSRGCSEVRTRLIGPVVPSQKLSSGLSRADETLLSQLRTGHHRSAGPLWRHLEPNRARTCRWCQAADSVETVPHLLFDCKNAEINRLRLALPRLARRKRNSPPLMGDKVTLLDLEQIAEFFRNILRLLN